MILFVSCCLIVLILLQSCVHIVFYSFPTDLSTGTVYMFIFEKYNGDMFDYAELHLYLDKVLLRINECKEYYNVK